MLHKIEANGKLYEVRFIFRRHDDTNENMLLMLKEKYRCDALVKNNTHYFLCNEITDIEFTELPIEIFEPINELNTYLQRRLFKH